MTTAKRIDWSIIVTIVIAIVSIAISGAVAYSQEMDTAHQRLAVVETRQMDLERRLTRIEATLDRLDANIVVLLGRK